MGVSSYINPDHTTQVGNTYKTALDDGAAVHHRLAGAFAPHAQSTPDMTVRLDAGSIPQWLAKPLEVAAQSTATIPAPVSNSRKDIVYIDAATGVVGVATGTPGASPSDPAIPAGKVAVARVTLTSATTAISNSLIDDLRTLQFLGMGTASGLNADTDGALAADSDTSVPTQKAVVTYVAAEIAAATVTDIVARNQIALANLRLLINTSVATGALVQGKQWELPSDEWASGSSGYTFTSASPNYYVRTASGGTSTTPTSGNWTIFGSTFTAGTGAITYGASSGEDAFTTSAVLSGDFTFTATVGNSTQGSGGLALQMGVATSTFVSRASFDQVGNSSVGSWWFSFIGSGASRTLSFYNDNSLLGTVTQTVNVGDTFTISRSGTALVVKLNGSTIYTFSGFNSSAALWGGFGQGLASNGYQWSAVSWTVNIVAGSATMTLVSPAVSLSAMPNYADTYLLYKDDDGTSVLGTDITVEMSRDGGATWTVATITNLLGSGGFDGTYSVIEARANVGTQPSGTSLKARIKTLNSKSQRIAAPAIYAE